MTRFRLIIITCMAVLGITAVAAASASANAPRWKVAGAYLGAGVAEPISVTSGTSKLSVPALGITIVCTSDKSTGGSIVGSAAGSPGTNKEIVIDYEGCTVEGASACKVSEPITTNKLKSELVWLTKEGNEAGDRLIPESGTTFVTIKLTGCALENSYPVTGEVIGKVKPVETEATSGTLEFPSPAILKYWTGDKPNRVEHTIAGLKFGGQTATYVSTETIKLTSGKKFGVFE